MHGITLKFGIFRGAAINGFAIDAKVAEIQMDLANNKCPGCPEVVVGINGSSMRTNEYQEFGRIHRFVGTPRRGGVRLPNWRK